VKLIVTWMVVAVVVALVLGGCLVDAAARGAPAGLPVRAEVAADSVAEPAAAPHPAVGFVTVKIGPYCDLSIDGIAHGRSPRAARIALPPGKHVLVCAQMVTGRQVTREFFLDALEHLVIRDSLVPQVEVTISVRAPGVRIDGLRHTSGARIRLTAGRHRVELAGENGYGPPAYVNVPSVPCTFRDRPAITCQ